MFRLHSLGCEPLPLASPGCPQTPVQLIGGWGSGSWGSAILTRLPEPPHGRNVALCTLRSLSVRWGAEEQEQGDRFLRSGAVRAGSTPGSSRTREGLSYPNHHPSNEELDFCVCGKTCSTSDSRPTHFSAFGSVAGSTFATIVRGTSPSAQTGIQGNVPQVLMETPCGFLRGTNIRRGAKAETGGLQQRLC